MDGRQVRGNDQVIDMWVLFILTFLCAVGRFAITTMASTVLWHWMVRLKSLVRRGLCLDSLMYF